MMRPIAFIGMPGSGKTTIGNVFAHSVNLEFFDTDTLIESQETMTIPNIFKEKGERYFRELEEKVISHLINNKSGVFVLSTGGGAVMTPAVKKLLIEKTVIIYIDVSLELLWQHLNENSAGRPLLEGDDPYAKLKALYKQRLPVYKQAHLLIDGNKKTIDSIVTEITAKLSEECLI